MVHAFHGNKVTLGRKLERWHDIGLQPLAVALLGIEEAPPLWTHPMGCDFVRGTRIVARPQVAQQRKLTSLQVLLLQSLWTPMGSPNSHNSQLPWPSSCQSIKTLCGQHASLQIPSKAIAPLLQSLQQRAGIDPHKTDLDVNEILASHSDPRYYQWQRTIMDHIAWQLNPTDTGYLDVQCTGLGGRGLDTD